MANTRDDEGTTRPSVADYARPIIEFALIMCDRCCAVCGTSVLREVVAALSADLAKRESIESSVAVQATGSDGTT